MSKFTLDTDKDTKEDIHKAYKTLIKVEKAFKTLKTDYLEIRPLYLKTDKRIKGHIALSMLAYNIMLKLKEYMNLCNLDFKSSIELLKSIKTTPVQLTKKISSSKVVLCGHMHHPTETIDKVNGTTIYNTGVDKKSKIPNHHIISIRDSM